MRPCADCPKMVWPASKRCKSCAARRKYADPAAREKMAEAKRRQLAANPDQLQHLREVGSAQLRTLHARLRVQGYRKRTRGCLADCPEHRRGEFRKMLKQFSAEEALRIILEDEAEQKRRAGRREVEANRRAMQQRRERDQREAY